MSGRLCRGRGIASLLVAAVLIALAGCGGSGRAVMVTASTACGGGANASAGDVAALRASTAYEGDVAAHARHVTDVLPGRHGDVSDSAVVGVIASVTRREGYGAGESATAAGGSRPVLDFDDPKAQWRNLDLTVSVSETLAGPPMSTVTVPWGLPGNSKDGADADAVCRALLHLGRVVMFSHATPGSSPGYYGIARMMIDVHYNFATLDARDRLHFPFIGSDEKPSEATFLHGVQTLTQLRAAAKSS